MGIHRTHTSAHQASTTTRGRLSTTLNSAQHSVPQVPVIHFGDLDPNGVRIFQHLRGLRRDLRWFVPSFWEELVEAKGLRGAWLDGLDLHGAPELVQRLAREELWLEQEPIAVDPRTSAALEAML